MLKVMNMWYIIYIVKIKFRNDYYEKYNCNQIEFPKI